MLRIKEVPGSNNSQMLSPATETITVFRYIPQVNDAIGTPNVTAYNYLVMPYKEILFLGTPCICNHLRNTPGIVYRIDIQNRYIFVY